MLELSTGQVCANPQLTQLDLVGSFQTCNQLVRLSNWVIRVNIRWRLVSGEAKNHQKSTKSLQIQRNLTRSI